MRIAIIGGSSFSTPNLLQCLDSNQESEGIDVVLASRSAEKLEAVKRASSLVSGNIEILTKKMPENTWQQVLDGADCVLIQIRVGGYEGRLFDETFPHKYGLCGDEGLGASGFSVGWRTWPVLAEILEAIGRFCPRAFVILLTSPLSQLVRAAYKQSNLNLVGICELPWTTLQGLIRSVSSSLVNVQADYLGINHLGWFFNFRSGPLSLLEEVAAATSNDSFPLGSFLQTHRCFPTRYLRMHYEPEKTLAEQRCQKTPRAAVLKSLQEKAHITYLKGSAADVVATLEVRRTPWYSQAVGPLILSLSGQPTQTPFFLSVRHSSYTELLDAEDVVECQHRCDAGRLVRVPLAGPPPEHVAKNLVPFVLCERVATEAMMNRSVPLLMEALSLHPWTRGHAKLKSIANEIVAYNQGALSTLPR